MIDITLSEYIYGHFIGLTLESHSNQFIEMPSAKTKTRVSAEDHVYRH